MVKWSALIERINKSFIIYYDYVNDVGLRKQLAEWEAFYNFHRQYSAHAGKSPYEMLKIKLRL